MVVSCYFYGALVFKIFSTLYNKYISREREKQLGQLHCSETIIIQLLALIIILVKKQLSKSLTTRYTFII